MEVLIIEAGVIGRAAQPAAQGHRGRRAARRPLPVPSRSGDDRTAEREGLPAGRDAERASEHT